MNYHLPGVDDTPYVVNYPEMDDMEDVISECPNPLVGTIRFQCQDGAVSPHKKQCRQALPCPAGDFLLDHAKVHHSAMDHGMGESSSCPDGFEGEELESLVVVVERGVSGVCIFFPPATWMVFMFHLKITGAPWARARTVFFAVSGEGLDEDCLDLMCSWKMDMEIRMQGERLKHHPSFIHLAYPFLSCYKLLQDHLFANFLLLSVRLGQIRQFGRDWSHTVGLPLAGWACCDKIQQHLQTNLRFSGQLVGR